MQVLLPLSWLQQPALCLENVDCHCNIRLQRGHMLNCTLFMYFILDDFLKLFALILHSENICSGRKSKTQLLCEAVKIKVLNLSKDFWIWKKKKLNL